MSELRKASEVLLDLESKIDSLIGLVKTQDLNIKILSNKLKEIIDNKPVSSPKSTITAVNTAPSPTAASPLENFQPVDPERQIPVFAESKLPETNSPQGFRRTARPDTYSDGNEQDTPKFPVQIPRQAPPGREAVSEVVAPLPPVKQTGSIKGPIKPAKTILVQNAIPVYQRVVDKNGKSIFLADVELTDLSSGDIIHKTRTNGTGKWMASLSIGTYRVSIKKRENVNKPALEAIQDVQVQGDTSPLELQTLIIK